MDTIVYLLLSFKQIKISVWDILVTTTIKNESVKCSSHERIKLLLNLIVEGKHQGTSSSSDDIREATLEEGCGTLLFVDFGEAIHGTIVHLLTLSRGHHESSSHGIKWVRDDTSGNGNDLTKHESSKETTLSS